MRKSILLAGLVLASIATSAGAKDWKEIRIATEGAYPPFNFVDANGTLKGFDVDIANALCEEMKAKCTLVANDWDGMIPGLQAGKFDAVIASMSVTEERQKQVDFTNKYYSTPLAIAVPKDSSIKIMKPESFAGKTIGAQGGTTQSIYAEDVLAKAGAEVKLYVSNDEANADLKTGRLDAMISDKFPVVDWLKTDDGSCCHILEDVPGTQTETGIALKKGNADLQAQFNAAIDGIRKNGTYDKIMKNYFDFDIY